MKLAEGPPPRSLRPGAGGYAPDTKEGEFLEECLTTSERPDYWVDEYGPADEPQEIGIVSGSYEKVTPGLVLAPRVKVRSGAELWRIRYTGPAEPGAAIADALNNLPKRYFEAERVDG